MKKIVLILLTAVLVFVFTACSGERANDYSANDAWNDEGVNDWLADDVEEIENAQPSTNTPEWRQFLKEYEAWVDDYIEIVKKYSDNPTDMSIMADYMDMVADLAEWSTKTEKMEEELENASASELAEYVKELTRIAAKLAKVAY